jgi:hypothetical protein
MCFHSFCNLCKFQNMGKIADGWVDFGASARRSDGKQDGGDALELTVRVNDQPKPEVMRELARQLVSEAREAVENAAQRGEQPPQWVQAFMSPAGWEHYHQRRVEVSRSFFQPYAGDSNAGSDQGLWTGICMGSPGD